MTTNNQTSPEDSLALCAQDSGYADYTDACEQTSSAADKEVQA